MLYHVKALEAVVKPEGVDGERPNMICERDLVARYGRGNRQHSLSGPRSWRLLGQICIDRTGEGGIIVQCVDPGRGHAAVRLDQRETCIGGADVANQADLWHVHKMASDAARFTKVFALMALTARRPLV